MVIDIESLVPNFAMKVKIERIKRNWSQEELADRLNVSSNTVAKIECGLRRPSVDFVVDLVNFFVSVKPQHIASGAKI